MPGLAHLITIYHSDDGLPIYLQINRRIKILAVTGVISPGDELPSVRELSRVIDVAPMTVSKAYAILKEDGYVIGRQGTRLTITAKCTELDKWEIVRSDFELILLDAKLLFPQRDLLLSRISETI